MIEFDMSGLEAAVRETVEQVREGVSEEALRATGYSGAELFRAEAKRNAAGNAKTWNLYNNIIVKRVEEDSSGAERQVYLVTVRTGKKGPVGAFYWRFVERGHKFVPRNTKVSKKTGKKIGWKAHREAAELEYGTARAPAYPFMRPAYHSKRQAAVDAMTKTLAEQIQRNLERA